MTGRRKGLIEAHWPSLEGKQAGGSGRWQRRLRLGCDSRRKKTQTKGVVQFGTAALAVRRRCGSIEGTESEEIPEWDIRAVGCYQEGWSGTTECLVSIPRCGSEEKRGDSK